MIFVWTGLRCLTLIAVAFLVSATAAVAATLPAQKERARLVEAQVAAANVRLERIVNAWDGARLELATVDGRLQKNSAALAVARSNLHAAQRRIEQRLTELYRSPNPSVADVVVGATSVSNLIDGIETARVLASQDAAIGRQAIQYQRTVARREKLLARQRRTRALTVAALSSTRQTIAHNLANQRRLLGSIHENIRTLEARQAANERRRATQARARIARQVALARAQAAAAAVTPVPTAALLAPPTPPPTTPLPSAAAPDPAAVNPAAAPAPAGPVPATPAPVIPAAPPTETSAASIAARYLGVPYLWGGASPAGFDCSGLVSYVYAQLGVFLPHYTVAQWNATTPISTSELEPGDLVFFDGLGHVGIYIGGGQFIHAPHTGTVVQIATLSGYWAEHLDGARRVP